MEKFRIRVPEGHEYASLMVVPDKGYNHDRDDRTAAYRLWHYIQRCLPAGVARELQSLVDERPLWIPYSEEEHAEESEVARRLRTGL